MAPLDLAELKTRLVTCGTIVLGGAIAAAALTAAAGTSPVTIASVGLSNAAAGVMGGLTANDIGAIVQRLRHDRDLLENHDLTRAVGLSIAVVIYNVAKDNQYSDYKTALEKIAKKSVTYWQTIAKATRDDDSYAGIQEAQLVNLFSSNPADFAKVTALDIETWEHAIAWLCQEAGVSLPDNVRKYVASRLYRIFPKALREVLKHDASKKGQAFAAMQLDFLSSILSGIRGLNSQYPQLVKQLEAVKSQYEKIVKGLRQVNAQIGQGLENVKTQISGMKEELEAIASALAPTLPSYSYNRTLIEEKTKDFVGRDYVFEAIAQFLSDRQSGYFILEAEPGFGKSTILAAYVKRTGCPSHFNVQSTNKNRTDLFLKNICTQLIEIYQLDYKTIPLEATQDSDFLERLLDEVSRKIGTDKLVIAIDALDEVDLSSQNPNTNVLYLPVHLPKNVYFVMTQRPDKKLPFLVEAPQKTFDLMAYPELNRQDVESYLQQRLAKNQTLRHWVAAQNLQDSEFVTQLADKSQSNFMYLRYVLPDIEEGYYKDLSIKSLPKGLNKYYEQHWHNMGMMANTLPQLKIDTIYIIVEFAEPVSAELIADVVQEPEHEVREVLEKWEQFLREEEIEGEICYSIYHASFRDFLHKQHTLKRSNVKLADIEKRITDNLGKGLKKNV